MVAFRTAISLTRSGILKQIALTRSEILKQIAENKSFENCVFK
jgi:hypothetical protein